MKTTTFGIGLSLIALVGCDRTHYDNAMDANGTAYHPNSVETTVYPQNSGTVSPAGTTEVAAPTTTIQATGNPGWIFHHWNGGSLTGLFSNPIQLGFEDQTTVSVQAQFLPSWSATDTVLVEKFDQAYKSGDYQTDASQAIWIQGFQANNRDGYIGAWASDSNGFSPKTAVLLGEYLDWNPALIHGAGPDGSTCLHVKWSLPDYASFAGFRLELGGNSAVYNLLAVTTLEFRAKGSGELRVGFEVDTAQRMGDWGSLDTTIQLTTNWTLYRIAAANLKPSQGSLLQKKWASIQGKQPLAKVPSVLFHNADSPTPGDQIDIWLDDVRLVGTPGIALLPTLTN